MTTRSLNLLKFRNNIKKIYSDVNPHNFKSLLTPFELHEIESLSEDVNSMSRPIQSLMISVKCPITLLSLLEPNVLPYKFPKNRNNLNRFCKTCRTFSFFILHPCIKNSPASKWLPFWTSTPKRAASTRSARISVQISIVTKWKNPWIC